MSARGPRSRLPVPEVRNMRRSETIPVNLVASLTALFASCAATAQVVEERIEGTHAALMRLARERIDGT